MAIAVAKDFFNLGHVTEYRHGYHYEPLRLLHPTFYNICDCRNHELLRRKSREIPKGRGWYGEMPATGLRAGLGYVGQFDSL
ncbi:MAG: hypothetical protein IKU02_04455 [Bacteroidaceae bacterium]|nr:hypothetical protein [Bacteroidaceae bacterium]